MILRSDSKYPIHRTYVVKLSSEATPASLSGRIENLVTCESSDFSSIAELGELLARDIDPARLAEEGWSDAPNLKD